MSEVVAALAGAPTAGKGKGKKRTADEAGLSAQDAEVEEMSKWKVARLRTALQGASSASRGAGQSWWRGSKARSARGTVGSGKEAGGESSGGSSSGGASSSSASGPGTAR